MQLRQKMNMIQWRRLRTQKQRRHEMSQQHMHYIQQSLQLLHFQYSQQRKLNNPRLQSCLYPR